MTLSSKDSLKKWMQKQIIFFSNSLKNHKYFTFQTPQKTQQSTVSLNRSQPKETTTTSPTSGESSPRRKPVPVFQISPQQLHMAMQQFFRSQQQQQSSANVKDETTAESSPTTSPMAGTAGTPASPGKCEVGVQVKAPQNGGDGEAEEYVDVVGDGVEARSSFLKLQRKAHIEFYRQVGRELVWV